MTLEQEQLNIIVGLPLWVGLIAALAVSLIMTIITLMLVKKRRRKE